jgi:hypothetical protein
MKSARQLELDSLNQRLDQWRKYGWPLSDPTDAEADAIADEQLRLIGQLPPEREKPDAHK